MTFGEAFRFWLKLGFVSFGGPAGQIAIVHRELVERRRWIGEGRFLHALNFCMLLPGPEAMQLVTYIGWLMHRTWGGIVAGLDRRRPRGCGFRGFGASEGGRHAPHNLWRDCGDRALARWLTGFRGSKVLAVVSETGVQSNSPSNQTLADPEPRA